MKPTIPEGKMKYTPQPYTILEVLFHNWRWVRKLSKSYWVHRLEEGYQWVKFDRQEMIDNGFCFESNPDYLVEDYTVKKSNTRVELSINN